MSLPNEHPSFKTPTINEALCELHFLRESGKEWDSAWYGDLFKRVITDYPRMEPNEILEVGVAVGPDGVLQSARRIGLRMQYHHKDRKHLFQLSDGVFTVNELAPYPGWDTFIADIERGWQLFSEIVHPTGLARIGLRYINEIPKEQPDEPVSRWLAPTEYIPAQILSARERFHSRLQVPVGADHRLVVTIAELEQPDRTRSILFDIDTILNVRVTADWAAIRARLTDLHETAWKVFRGSITPDLNARLEGRQHVQKS